MVGREVTITLPCTPGSSRLETILMWLYQYVQTEADRISDLSCGLLDTFFTYCSYCLLISSMNTAVVNSEPVCS